MLKLEVASVAGVLIEAITCGEYSRTETSYRSTTELGVRHRRDGMGVHHVQAFHRPRQELHLDFGRLSIDAHRCPSEHPT
jgi:hypothetical protein